SSNPTSIAPLVFTFDYPGFSGIPMTMQVAHVDFNPSFTDSRSITVFATAGFQNGANTITVPNLLAILGTPFYGCCSSGTRVHWSAEIFAGTAPFSSVPPGPVLG